MIPSPPLLYPRLFCAEDYYSSTFDSVKCEVNTYHILPSEQAQFPALCSGNSITDDRSVFHTSTQNNRSQRPVRLKQ